LKKVNDNNNNNKSKENNMTYLIQKKPTEKPIIKMKGYALYSTGELWKTGKHGYRAGYVMNKNEDGMIIAIENHEEDMNVVMASIHREFGG
tara:strand:- start:5707 stop:5979 length:273 start_codon:yes stop_codon:yes gene_type:complete